MFKQLSNMDLNDFTFKILEIHKTVPCMNEKPYNNISGVYCIRNTKNDKRYIGMSKSIFKRWEIHVNACINQRTKTHLLAEMNKDTLKDFEFSILEVTDDIEKREQYWINYYDSINHGYNRNDGGYAPIDYSKYKRRVTEEQVIEIRTRYANLEIKRFVYKDFKDKMGISTFTKIWNGTTWKHIMPEVYTPENIQYHKTHFGFEGCNNPRARLTREMAEDIREKLNQGLKPTEIYKDYENLFNKTYFCCGICKKIKDGIW